MFVFTPAEWKEQAKKNKAFYMDVITEGIVLFGTRPVVECFKEFIALIKKELIAKEDHN